MIGKTKTLQYGSPYNLSPPLILSCSCQVGFALSSTGHTAKVIAPEDVGTQVLKYLMSITADFLGHDQVCCVILVPLKWLKPDYTFGIHPYSPFL
jgi:hypothetical protein